MADLRIVQCIALLSFTGEEGSLRVGMRFLTTKTRADWLSEPIKGQRPALAKILYETQTEQPQVETKAIETIPVVEEKPKRKRVRKSESTEKPKKRRRRSKSKGDN